MVLFLLLVFSMWVCGMFMLCVLMGEDVLLCSFMLLKCLGMDRFGSWLFISYSVLFLFCVVCEI